MNDLNAVLASAHDPAKSCMDNCLAVLTLYTSPWCFGSHYERVSGKHPLHCFSTQSSNILITALLLDTCRRCVNSRVCWSERTEKCSTPLGSTSSTLNGRATYL